jgi:hypothetical protein
MAHCPQMHAWASAWRKASGPRTPRKGRNLRNDEGGLKRRPRHRRVGAYYRGRHWCYLADSMPTGNRPIVLLECLGAAAYRLRHSAFPAGKQHEWRDAGQCYRCGCRDCCGCDTHNARLIDRCSTSRPAARYSAGSFHVIVGCAPPTRLSQSPSSAPIALTSRETCSYWRSVSNPRSWASQV